MKMNTFKILGVLTIILSIGFSGAVLAGKGGKKGKGDGGGITPVAFILVGAMNDLRSSHTATKLLDGRVLIAGGLNDPDPSSGAATVNKSVEIYDPSTRLFTPASPMNRARTQHSATLLSDGTVLVIGGNSQSNLYGVVTETTAEIYNPATNSWSLIPNEMVTGHWDHNATLLANGDVLLTSNGFTWSWYGYGDNSAELYEAATQSFTELSSMSAVRVQHVSSMLPDGSVILIGGQQDNIWKNSIETYDVNSRSFIAGGSMNYLHEGLSGVTLNEMGDALISGQVSVWTSGNDAEKYNAASNSFAQVGNMVQTRQEHTSSLSSDGASVLIAGGVYEWVTSDNFVRIGNANTAELYDVATGKFSSAGSLNFARRNHTSTALNDGSFLITGGSIAPTSAELFKQ